MTNSKIGLSANEIQYMLLALELPAHLRSKLEAVARGEADLLTEEASELRDLVGERLQVHGFDENYEPTGEGKYLEYLVDRLFTG